ncbi:unnamed protein product [Cochlearia groenlandica]
MSSWVCSYVARNVVIADYSRRSSSLTQLFGLPAAFRRKSVTFPVTKPPLLKLKLSQSSRSMIYEGEEEDPESVVQALKIPNEWLLPSKAMEESEWLKLTLHKWLDDEYCPEPTNAKISEVAAKSYYNSLLEKETDMGAILLKMAQDLTSISYQESFHGAFTSANAAIDLIVKRVETGLD